MHSLWARLFSLWLLSLAAGIAVALLLVQLYEQSADAQVGRAEAVIARACDLIGDRFDFFTSGWKGAAPDLNSPAIRLQLANVVGLALTHQEGVEGGIWHAATGPLAYAYPTYEGSGPKTDLPSAERDQIAAINQRAGPDNRSAEQKITNRSQTLLLHACSLPGPISGLTGWTMTRVMTAPGFGPLTLGLAVLFGLLVVMALWLGRMLLVWGRHVQGIEVALAAAPADAIPELQPTGERELDRIISALNDAGKRLIVARREADASASRAARAERLASLGRVAAGVAHEIRNPIAAAQLQGENALAGDDARRNEAITDILAQLSRLNGLVNELLAMTQRAEPHPLSVDLNPFINDCLKRHSTIAGERHIQLRAHPTTGSATFDPVIVGRVLDNLLTNAIRHTPNGSDITVTVEHSALSLTFEVTDSGSGVAPELTCRLFEPFVTGRADGTGLGLAIARELADAHGGQLLLRRSGDSESERGAIFAFVLPCQPS
jgi:signal transduction histidine kinase